VSETSESLGGSSSPLAVVTSGETITRTMDGAVAVLSMVKPPYNLMDGAMNRELVESLKWAKGQGARAIVLRSGLRHFSAGADLDAMLDDIGEGDTLGWDFAETLRAFAEHPAPIVASVHGVCVGGGFELALACDLVIASSTAKIGCVEVTVGLHPLMGAVQRIAQRAGAARAKEMALLGRRYDAATLERWNVINRVVDEEHLESATMVLAHELAHGPSVANAATKQLVAIAVDEGVRAADEQMADIQRSIYTSQDLRTGVNAYRDSGIGTAEFEGR